jgi:cell division septation protein DedD
LSVAAHTQDDAFHEIQLNGKQLVFLFMAATVVSVVIFLCGVLVGRGVRAERGGTVADAALGVAVAETMPQRPGSAPAPSPMPAGSDPTAVAPPPAADDLSYFNRLEKPNRPADDLKPAPASLKATARTPEKQEASAAVKPEKTAGAKPETAVPAEPRATASPAPKEPGRAQVADAVGPEQAAPGFAVQIAALNIRTEAEAIAKRLSSKGYSAYVIPPASGTPAVFRVRVGKFGTRREAETVAARLQKEEQFKPWITR